MDADERPKKGRAGRPRREEGARWPRDEVERLLVEGEMVTGPDGDARRVWPSQRDLARRFSVAPSLISAFATEKRCAERRAALRPQEAPKKEAAPSRPAPRPPRAASERPPAPVVPLDPARRKPGRPAKRDAPVISYEELDRLLVFGEVVLDENGIAKTTYPSYRQLAARYGVVVSVIAEYARSRNCVRRRKAAATRVALRTEEKIVERRADAIAVGEERLIQMIDGFLLSFEKALEEGRVRSDNPTDVNTLARLKAFVLGGADSRQEVRAMLSLENLQARYARAMREQQEATPAMAGVIEARAPSLEAAEEGALSERPPSSA